MLHWRVESAFHKTALVWLIVVRVKGVRFPIYAPNYC